MSKKMNAGSINDYKKTFPVDKRDYFYYYNVSKLKRLKLDFNEINSANIIGKDFEHSLFANYNPKQTIIDAKMIYNEYKQYCNDFNYYIDKLISGKDINNNDDFQNTIEYLMVTICDLNEFIDRYILLKGNKGFLKQKAKYLGSEKTIKYILSENQILIYKLNTDYIPNLIINFSIKPVYLLILLFIFIISIRTSNFLFGILFEFYAILYLRIFKLISYSERQNPVYLAKYKYVAHPFVRKIKLTDIVNSLQNIKQLIKKD